ncbi:MAG: IS66 family transposase [Butyrivibrio sp.]|nr:IS66 family transposase [Butyrivibrio sp.]
MTLKEAYEKRRQECLSLQRQLKKAEKTIEELSVGTYVDKEKAEHLRTINRLSQEVKHLNNQLNRFKGWYAQQSNYAESKKDEIAEIRLQNEELKSENDALKTENAELKKRLNAVYADPAISENNELLQAKISALEEEILRLNSIANNDGTNSGLPTSQMPIGKKKVVPNSRVKTGKKKGGQVGHKKHSLTPLADDDIDETIEHSLESCPKCGGDLKYVGERHKDVIDYKITVIKTRHIFYEYECLDCGKTVHSPIPLNIKEPVQYGSKIQALSLALINQGFVSINRTAQIISGLMHDQISLSQGYICKLQKRASGFLKPFVSEVRMAVIRLKLVYWDDTVIFINTARACMRFYGNEKLALYKAHESKDRVGIDEDSILAALSPDTIVMHDHNTINYNDDFQFQNIECNEHLSRDLQSLIDDSGHSWCIALKKLIQEAEHERKQLMENGYMSFDDEYIREFNRQLDEFLEKADEEYLTSSNRYFETDERRLIARLKKYRKNYFMWLSDFSLPTTNNLSERSLRFTKTKQKVSGQFVSQKYSEYFADIRTYIETCYRNGVNCFKALSRLTAGNPYTLEELSGEA